MHIEVKLDVDFEEFLSELKHKYPKELFALKGIAHKQLNHGEFIDNFVNVTKFGSTADTSVDPNSNVGSKDMVTLLNEMAKPMQKLLALNKLFYEAKKKYGLEYAKIWLEMEINHTLYMSDLNTATFVPYCYNYDISKIAHKGLFFLADIASDSPKHLDTFVSHTLEFVVYACNASSGSTGLASWLVEAFYFWNKDKKEGYCKDAEKYKIQQFQNFYYSLNQPYTRSGIQSSFTNLNLMDRNYLYALFGDKKYPDGNFMVDYIEDIMQFQKDFMIFLSKERSKKFMTFPVLCACLLYTDGKFQDEEFAKFCVENNNNWYDYNFYISKDVDSISSCCFDKNQKILAKGQNVLYDTFENIYNLSHNEYKKNFRIFHNGNWVYGNIKKIPRINKKMFKITTANNKELLMTEDHLSLTTDGLKRTDTLLEDDYIAFSTNELGLIPERNMNVTYEQGVLIGAYLGDGSATWNIDRQEGNNTLNLSLNKEKYEILYPILDKAIKQMNCYGEIKLGKEYNNVYPVRICDKKIKDFIKHWVYGKNAIEKDINKECLLQSKDFRKGIIDGIYLTDGGNSNRIYSTSLNMIESLEVILTSLGIISIIDKSDRTGEGKVEIRGEKYNRNYPLYCIRYYGKNKNLRNMKNIYKTINNTIFFKVKSIEEYNTEEKYVYCFEMKNEEEPYFTLPNGVITHNCRLYSSTKTLGMMNGIAGSDLDLGSVKVSTINLPRVAYMSKNPDEYIKNLKEITNINLKILDIQRGIIKRNIEKGLLPLYDYGIIDMKRQYSTIGVIGLKETLDKFEMIEIRDNKMYYTEEGIKLAERIMKTLNECKDGMEVDYLFNVEFIAGETIAWKFAKADKLLLGDMVKDDIYGNQYIPLTENTDLAYRIELASILDKYSQGGCSTHLNIEGGFTNFEQSWEMVNYIASKGVALFCFNHKINICKDSHGFIGTDICPICGEPVYDTIQKIVGYMTPSKNYSKERKEEFKNRMWETLK